VDLELALCSDVPNREQSFVCRLGFAQFVKDLKRWGRGICVSVHEPLCPLCAARELLASAGGVRLGLSSPRTAAIHGSMDGFCFRFSNFPPSSRRLQNNSTVANLSVLGPRCEAIHCLNFYLALCHLSCIINWPETIFVHLVPSFKRRFLNLQDPKSLLVWDTHRGIETTARLPFLAFRCYPRCMRDFGPARQHVLDDGERPARRRCRGFATSRLGLCLRLLPDASCDTLAPWPGPARIDCPFHSKHAAAGLNDAADIAMTPTIAPHNLVPRTRADFSLLALAT
jgi:hypothetical protein